ncbi:MAG: M23 family metallopeptidase [Syntrophomonadaceae bacterium]|nr:M23 family metallopeptidase [Syntrophomonadaceae bacterium]
MLAAAQQEQEEQIKEAEAIKQFILELKDGFQKMGEQEKEIRRLMGLEVESESASGSQISRLTEEQGAAALYGQGGGTAPIEAGAALEFSALDQNRDIVASQDIKEELAELTQILKNYQNNLDRLTQQVKADPEYYRSLPNQAPVEGRLTSGFGLRTSPFGKKQEMHTGIDLAAPYGTPIKAAGDGRVVFADTKPVYGLTVIIDHGRGMITHYGHNSKLLVKEGEQVQKGDIIALMGSSGRSTGPHLHFALEYNGEFINPVLLLPYY